jgi:hypothetical protein
VGPATSSGVRRSDGEGGRLQLRGEARLGERAECQGVIVTVKVEVKVGKVEAPSKVSTASEQLVLLGRGVLSPLYWIVCVSGVLCPF